MIKEHHHQGGYEPIMPHRVHAEGELDVLYPSLKVTCGVDDEDLQIDGEDDLARCGEGIANGITHDAVEHGRKRVTQ